MSDLHTVLPHYRAPERLQSLLPRLERHLVTVADILTLDPSKLGPRASIGILEIQMLRKSILETLQSDLKIGQQSELHPPSNAPAEYPSIQRAQQRSGADLSKSWNTISTLDKALDAELGGGFPPGYISEIAGESATGKTQFLLTLLLSAQLPPPLGLSRSTIYISTEDALPTTRLIGLLNHHPHISSLPSNSKPSLDRIVSIRVPDLESQEHVLTFQLRNAIRRYKAGLVVLDSVAAHYRAEQGSHLPRSLAHRAHLLAKLGKLLSDIAVEENVAIVVANQVSDHFGDPVLRSTSTPWTVAQHTSNTPYNSARSSSPAQPPPSSAPSSTVSSSSAPVTTSPATALHTLDFQQRFFSGWGDSLPFASITHNDTVSALSNPKTPSLGLTWSQQVSCRIALRLESAPILEITPDDVAKARAMGEEGGSEGWKEGTKRRFLRVVWAKWTGASNGWVEYWIRNEGVSGIEIKSEKEDEEEGDEGDEGDEEILEGI